MNYRQGNIIKSKKTGKYFQLGRNLNKFWWEFRAVNESGEMTISVKGLKRYTLTDLTLPEIKLILAL